MFGFSRYDDEYDRPRRRSDRSLSTRLAWFVLLLGAGLLILRASLATVIEIHGDGMAPTLLDGDHVVLVRGSWGLQAGDIVIYRPTPAADPEIIKVASEPSLEGSDDPETRLADPRRPSAEPLRNTAVIDIDDLHLDEEWAKVQRRSGLDRPPESSEALRVGRILALPGDLITFDSGRSNLTINGVEIEHKASGIIELMVRGRPDPSEAHAEVARARPRGSAFEMVGGRRFRVLQTPGQIARWPGMALPGDPGPVELIADGYLILADNRDDGACCDSRALGFVPQDQVQGEILVRLGGSEHVPDDIDPRSRGFLWRP